MSSIDLGDVRLVRSIHNARTSSRACNRRAVIGTTASITAVASAARGAHRTDIDMGGTGWILADFEQLSQSGFGVLADGISHEIGGFSQPRDRLRICQRGLLHADARF